MKRQKVRNETTYTRISAKNSDESDDETELYTRKSNTYKEIPTIDKIIEEGDTLQALSIRYYCSVSELKRLNNIHRENEIFARNTIKVPARPFSMGLVAVHVSGNSTPNENSEASNIDLNQTLFDQKLQDSLEGSNISASTDFNSVIFNSNIVNKSCDNIQINDNVLDDVNEDEVSLLPIETNSIVEPNASRFACSGADADISWIALIVVIVVICITIPLVFIIYIAEHPPTHHNHTHLGQQ